MNDEDQIVRIPRTPEAWQPLSSTKINVVLQLLRYHSKEPGRLPVKLQETEIAPGKFMVDPANILVEDPSFEFDQPPSHASPDKIIISCAYPSYNDEFLVPVSILRNAAQRKYLAWF